MQFALKPLIIGHTTPSNEIVLQKEAIDGNVFGQFHGVFSERTTVSARLHCIDHVAEFQEDIFAFGKHQ